MILSLEAGRGYGILQRYPYVQGLCQRFAPVSPLDQQHTPKTDNATLDELVRALESSVEYLQATKRQPETDEAEVRQWLREARRFLRARRG